jgi:hypothetical protein
VSQPVYVRFPTLKDDDPNNSNIDLGFVYIDSSKKYSKTVPFLIDNVSDVRERAREVERDLS